MSGARRVELVSYRHGWIISDEDGEFARATTIDQALTYAANLMHGPGTGAHVTMETYPSMRFEQPSPDSLGGQPPDRSNE